MNLVLTDDNSYTAYSREFDEHYHSLRDGALNEALNKHVIPALTFHQNSDKINILDICYGLGYNTLATLYYLRDNTKKIKIVSPEIDIKLVKSLKEFDYPKEFSFLRDIIEKLSNDYYYKSENIEIKIIIGDAREYLKDSNERFDIVYQDAFSMKKNPYLWTKEYFFDIQRVMSDNAILTTYSCATNVRMSMYVNGLFLYENSSAVTRSGTLAFKTKQKNYKYIDMELKKLRNPKAKVLNDKEFLIKSHSIII